MESNISCGVTTFAAAAAAAAADNIDPAAETLLDGASLKVFNGFRRDLLVLLLLLLLLCCHCSAAAVLLCVAALLPLFCCHCYVDSLGEGPEELPINHKLYKLPEGMLIESPAARAVVALPLF